MKKYSETIKSWIRKEKIINQPQTENKPKIFHEMIGTGKKQILFIHGFGLNRKSWNDISPMFAEKATVYMVDLIGFGDSPAPKNWPYTIEAQADVLINFIMHKDLKNVVIIGHSYGGGVGLMLLHKMIKNECSTRIKKLILIAPASFPQALPFFMVLPCIPFIGSFLLKNLNAEFLMTLTLKKIVKNKKKITRERIQRYIDNIMKRSHRHALIQTAKHIIPKEIDKVLEKIEQIYHSTLLIYGQNDSVILKQNLEKLSRTLPNVETKKVPNCGHVPHEENPKIVAGLISEFL